MRLARKKMLGFRNNEGDWKGPQEDTSLYRIWKQTNTLEQPTLEHETPTHENLETNANITTLDLENVAEKLLASEDIGSELPTSENVIDQTSSSANIAVEATTSNNIVEKPRSENIKPPKEQSPDPSIIQTGLSGLQLSGVLTANKEDNSQATITSVGPSIPSPFKRVLFWPEGQPSISKRRKREKLPSVLTSPQVIRYYQKKEEEKQQIIEKQREKKEQRLQKPKETEDRKKAADEQKRKNKEKNKNKRPKQHDIKSTTSESDSESVESASSSPWDEDFEEDSKT